MIETPRLVKKPGPIYKRIENQEELEAALADGWYVTLPVSGEASRDMPDSEWPINWHPEVVEPSPTIADESSGAVGNTEDLAEPVKRGPGRPKKHA